MSRGRSNPLLVRPPQHLHGVTGQHRVTRHGFEEPNIGVHTALFKSLAAAYGYAAWMKNYFPIERTTDYPAVVSLNVRGLRPEPDTDSVLWWFEHGGRESAREALKLSEEVGPQRAIDMMHEDGESHSPASVTSALIDPTFHGETVAWEDLLFDHGETVKKAVAGDREALRRVLLAGFPQRRYMVDFDVDRVIAIDVVKPWWEKILPYDLEDDVDRGDDSELLDLERQGWDLVTEDDVDHYMPTFKQVYHSRKDGQIEWHGTSGSLLVKAFPDLDLPDPKKPWRKIFQ